MKEKAAYTGLISIIIFVIILICVTQCNAQSEIRIVEGNVGLIDIMPRTVLPMPVIEKGSPLAIPYRVTWGKVALWTGMGVAGVMWGAREAYHADPSVFEKRWGVGEYSFFGSHAWERNYEGNRYHNADGGTNPHKPEWGNFSRDYWHFSGSASRIIWAGATFTIGAGKQPLKHKLLDMAIGSAVSVTAGWATYQYLRQ